MSFRKIQEEMVLWQNHNFPGRPAWIPLLGMVEEIGELANAYDCRNDIETKDAIGDVAIYLADFCNAVQYDMEEIWNSEQENGFKEFHLADNRVGLSIEIGILAHSFIKTEQKIRMHEDHASKGKRAIGRILYYLGIMSSRQGYPLEALVATVWQRVKQRDWQKNRDTAHQQESAG